jgi:hypothetical protein
MTTEDPAHPSIARQVPATGAGAGGTLLRRILLFGVPLVVGVTSVIHPLSLTNPGHEHEDGIYAQLGDEAGLAVGVHVVQLVMFGLLALSVWVAIRELRGRAAQVSRWALLPFVVFYTAFDSLVGIGTGGLVREGRQLPAADQDAAERLVNAYSESLLTGDPNVFALLGAAAWFVALVAAAVAWHRAGASRLTTAALALGGLVFAIGHPAPFGTIGMAFLLLAYWRLEMVEPKRRGFPRLSEPSQAGRS